MTMIKFYLTITDDKYKLSSYLLNIFQWVF